MKKIVAVIVAIFTLGSFGANAQKIGHIDYLMVVDSLPSKIQADQEIQKFYEDGQATVQDLTIALERAYKKYQAEEPTLSKTLKEVRMKGLQEQEEILNIKTQSLQQDLQTLQQKSYAPIEENLTKAIEIVAKRNGMLYILEKSQVMFAGGTDLTEEVKKEMMKFEVGN
jgi:outer membrane protein